MSNEIADKLRKIAQRNLRRSIGWQDSQDLHKVADLIEGKQYKKAAKYLDETDTDIRESVPSNLYNKIMKWLD